MTLEELTEAMVKLYGEACTKAQAGRILNRTNQTIYKMIEDGRIDEACAGKMIDVRSIARYIHEPRKQDFESRKRKLMAKYHSEFSV